MPAISISSGAVAATWPRFCGMTASGCRFTPSVWTAASSSGPRRRTVRCRSRRPRWPICWKGSTGEIRKKRGGRRAQADRAKKFGVSCNLGAPNRCIYDSIFVMDATRDAVPDDIAALKEVLAIERAKGLEIAAELAVARAKASEDTAL